MNIHSILHFLSCPLSKSLLRAFEKHLKVCELLAAQTLQLCKNFVKHNFQQRDGNFLLYASLQVVLWQTFLRHAVPRIFFKAVQSITSVPISYIQILLGKGKTKRGNCSQIQSRRSVAKLCINSLPSLLTLSWSWNWHLLPKD